MGLLEGISEIELYRENVTPVCEYTIVYLSLYFLMSLNIMDDCVSICYHISCTIGRTFHVKEIVKKKRKIQQLELLVIFQLYRALVFIGSWIQVRMILVPL